MLQNNCAQREVFRFQILHLEKRESIKETACNIPVSGLRAGDSGGIIGKKSGSQGPVKNVEDLFAMEKLRILFTGDSITDVNRTDMVRMTEEWMSRDPNGHPPAAGGGCRPGAGLRLPAAGGLPAGRPGARPLRVFKPGHLRQPGGGFGRPYQAGLHQPAARRHQHSDRRQRRVARAGRTQRRGRSQVPPGVRGDAPGNHPCPARGEAYSAGALCAPGPPPHWRTGTLPPGGGPAP